MHNLESIEKINKTYETNCTPFLVHCNNLKFYVTKYHTSQGPANRLYREYIASNFLPLWGIPCVPWELIKIKPEHLPTNFRRAINLSSVAIGFEHNKEYKEVDRFFDMLSYTQKNKIENTDSFLDIAFFDIWLANEDRNINNYNLMINYGAEGHFIIPIDHEACFNTGNLDKGLFTISFESSVLYSDLLLKLYKVKELNDKDWLEKLKKKWYICSKSCENHIDNILRNVPTDWQIDIETEREHLNKYLFNKEWFNECFKSFIEYIQRNINN